jgi:hypothetical protein
MFDLLVDAFEVLGDWNSPNRSERWIARGCGCVLFVIWCIVAVVAYLVLRPA